VAEDEIDLETGFLMMPQAIPQPAQAKLISPTPGGEAFPAVPPSPMGPSGGVAPPVTTPGPQLQKVVEVSFSADRNQLFTAWNAAANLADLAGKVTVTIKAESKNGFDRNKLQNGVLEPLREADLIK